jgi:hypothetical protein
MPQQLVLHAVDVGWTGRMTAYWSTHSVVYTNGCLGIVPRMIALPAEYLSMTRQLVTTAQVDPQCRLCYLYPLLVDQSLVDI